MNLRTAFVSAGLLAVATGALGYAQTVPGPGPAATPPPPPLPNTISRTPSPVLTEPSPTPLASTVPTGTPAPRGRRGRGPSEETSPSPGASPTETPMPPQFSSLDGTWELALQPPLKNVSYSHLVIVQKGDDLSGVWDQSAKMKIPFTGTFDGRLFKLSLKDGSGKELTMSGYEENFGDMVGIIDDGKTRTPFTANHRKKVKFSEEAPNVGIPGVGGGAPGGGR